MEAGMSAPGRGDSAAKIVAGVGVCTPETVTGVGELDSGLARGDVEPLPDQDVEEGHLHVDVVLREGVVYHLRLPRRHLLVQDGCTDRLELRRRAVGDAGGLSEPRTRHLVAVVLHRKPPLGSAGDDGRGGRKHRQHGSSQITFCTHNHPPLHCGASPLRQAPVCICPTVR